MVQLGLWLPSVRRYEHRAGQPDPEHGEDELGSVRQLDHHGLARLDAQRNAAERRFGRLPRAWCQP